MVFITTSMTSLLKPATSHAAERVHRGLLQGVLLLVALFFSTSATTAFAARRRHYGEVGCWPCVHDAQRCMPFHLQSPNGAAVASGSGWRQVVRPATSEAIRAPGGSLRQ